ncbi:hypothetical protein [Brevundimonas lenta]|uniref:Uncharacterized protein n=1 Tax=Brevundimonas lenta TaxID=424796 RepID=A0A7W6NNQ4_9CAUL|nr:hypothetical protein [Brevundimonas lenta]MBB4081392.1 hypothetical protein [Brevundimonas lenta]
MAGIGAIGAGVFLTLREFLPWLEANRTGAVRTRGARPQLVRRDEDPERFKDLTGRRLKAAGPGLLILAAGFGWLFWNVLAIAVSTAA